MQTVRVLVANFKLPELDYLAENDTKVGDLVVVPFRNTELPGIIAETSIESNFKNLREVSFYSGISISSKYIEFITRAARYYLAAPGSVTKLMLPVSFFQKKLSSKSGFGIAMHDSSSNVELAALSTAQQLVYESVVSDRSVSVLQGVTGSGKTEVYFHLILRNFKADRQSLLLLPEIALSSQIIERFTERFGFMPYVWNSSVTLAKKQMLLMRIISGEALVVIGTRSALFLPYKNLDLIIVDEEHDSSYKQESGVLYNARDMAVLRAHIFAHPLVLASATPSIETLYNASLGKYNLVKLEHRFGSALMPEVKVIDMRLQKLPKSTWLSAELKETMVRELECGNQVMLFLNRRGYAPLVLCTSCGCRITCSACSSWMVMHKTRKRLECHHCGNVLAIKTKCPECGLENCLIPCGPGVERIAEEVAGYFKEARVQMMTKEEMNSEASISGILHKIEQGEVDIIIGTQIITKGYHFPKLSLVGVVDADVGLSGADLKGSERAFQLLYQVGGRAGRAEVPGKVYLQTYDPESRIIKLLQNGEFEEFSNYELATREACNMPPYYKMASILLSGKMEEKVRKAAELMTKSALQHEHVKVMGPVPSMMSKLQNKYRFRILVVADRTINIQSYLKQWLEKNSPGSFIHIKIDVDPYSFY